MYYEPYKKKKRKRRGCLSRLIRLCFIVLIGFALWMVGSNLMMNTKDGWTNVLLLGGDSGEDGNRTDMLMIASIGEKGQIKLTSLMRDTMVSMGEYGVHKLNASYVYGGAGLTMRTINESFGTNITRYAFVDYSSFPPIIDALGGIELDVTKDEMNEINRNMRSAGRAVGVRANPEDYLKQYGRNIVLTGDQALGYARIRSLDSDYMRAQRQRNVLNAMMKKARDTKNPATLLNVAGKVLTQVDTNINIAELGALALRVVNGSGEVEQFRVPVEGTYTSGVVDGVWRIDADLLKNRKLLEEFIYAQ